MMASDAATSPPGSTRRRRGPLLTFGPGALVGALGAALTAVSGWLTWLTGSQAPHQSGYDTPAKFLLDSHTTAGGVTLGVVMLIIGVLGMIAAILAHGRVPAIALGVVSVVVAGLFVYQLRLAVHELNRTTQLALQVRDVIGIGPFAAAAGGVVAVIGALLPLRHGKTAAPFDIST
jgi:Ca2+/Na+ antiporter